MTGDEIADEIRKLDAAEFGRVLALAIDYLGEFGDGARDAVKQELRNQLEGDSAPYTEHGIDLLGPVLTALS